VVEELVIGDLKFVIEDPGEMPYFLKSQITNQKLFRAPERRAEKLCQEQSH
jgi:hypothetical protein